MTHCRGETSDENTRWRFLAGGRRQHGAYGYDQVDRIHARYPKVPARDGYHEQVRRGQPNVSLMPKNCPADAGLVASRLKIDAEYQPRLMAFEVDEIEAAPARPGAPTLACSRPRSTACAATVGNRRSAQRTAPGRQVPADRSLRIAADSGLPAEEEARTQLHHQANAQRRWWIPARQRRVPTMRVHSGW